MQKFKVGDIVKVTKVIHKDYADYSWMTGLIFEVIEYDPDYTSPYSLKLNECEAVLFAEDELALVCKAENRDDLKRI